jgi:hypothetical protein
VRPNVPELIVYSVVAGVATAIYDNADAWSDGTMTFDLQGTAIKVYFGASLKANLTDSSLVTGDSHGLYGRYDPSALHNDFTITTASAAIVGTLGLWDPDLDNKSWFDVTFG